MHIEPEQIRYSQNEKRTSGLSFTHLRTKKTKTKQKKERVANEYRQ